MTKERFEKSATAPGCHLCIIIAHAFDKTAVAAFSEMEPEAPIQLCFAYRSLQRDPSGKLSWEQRTHAPPSLLVTLDDAPLEFWLCIYSEGGFGVGNLDIRLRISPVRQASDQNNLMITTPRAHASTGNSQNIELARAWLRACDESHPMCKAFAPKHQDWRPSRLIDVGVVGKSLPKLVVSKDNLDAVPYCALSYCWGGSRQVVLTKETLSSFQTALPVSQFPQTILDAIMITRELGYSFLWVDAFCILQDSRADWELESPQMSDIYGLAAVTIAAGGSRTAQAGMFKRRDPRKFRPCGIKTDAEIASHFEYRNARWVVYPHRPEKLVTQAFGDNPLSLRGWTLQERILSPRLLMFGTDQILWSCVTTEACETFPSGMDPRFSTPLSELQSLANLRQRFMKLFYLGAMPSDFWHDIVRMYSKTELTVSSDKLVALQGIAARLQARLQQSAAPGERSTVPATDQPKYVAGLWRDKHFLKSMLWRTDRNSTRRRPRDYRAPSWSWASVDAEIISFEEFIPWSLSETFQPASVIDVHVEYSRPEASARLTGQVLSGSVDLECYLRPCYLKRTSQQDDPEHNSKLDAIIISAKDWDEVPRSTASGTIQTRLMEQDALGSLVFSEACTLDCPDEVPEDHWVRVYCVPIQLAERETDRYENPSWESYDGLVLAAIPDDEANPDNSAPTIGPGDNGSMRSSTRASANSTSDVIVEGNTCNDAGAVLFPQLPVHTNKDSKSRHQNSRNNHSAPTSTLRLFRRIGIFQYTVLHTEREGRLNELFGPLIHEPLPVVNRKRTRPLVRKAVRERTEIRIV